MTINLAGAERSRATDRANAEIARVDESLAAILAYQIVLAACADQLSAIRYRLPVTHPVLNVLHQVSDLIDDTACDLLLAAVDDAEARKATAEHRLNEAALADDTF